eukprot:GEMP01057182.1.p2 GENE.GEMP01057182.1~~GEMP01057182.1.p2  ORF type:complete len:133 (+),score=17.18 GEMP01057182.1:329-727(+)
MLDTHAKTASVARPPTSLAPCPVVLCDLRATAKADVVLPTLASCTFAPTRTAPVWPPGSLFLAPRPHGLLRFWLSSYWPARSVGHSDAVLSLLRLAHPIAYLITRYWSVLIHSNCHKGPPLLCMRVGHSVAH